MESAGETERIRTEDFQNQPIPQEPGSSSHCNHNNISRHQQIIMRQRQRRRDMTEEQRQSYLARRRTSYQRRRMELSSNNATPNQNLQRNQWRMSQRNRRQSMGEEARGELLARRRANYRSTRHRSTTSSLIPNNLASAESTTYTSKNVQQICRIDPIPYHALTSNFEHGSTSACQWPSDYEHEGTHFNENNVITNVRRYPRPRRYHNLARNSGESEINYRLQLSDPRICIHCQALLFHGETSQLCCRNRKTNLDHIPSPSELQELYAADNEESKHFRQYIRAYNHVFSFTSMRVNIDESLATGTHGIYTFRVHGSIYHSIGSLLPNDNCRPRYMQMFTGISC